MPQIAVFIQRNFFKSLSRWIVACYLGCFETCIVNGAMKWFHLFQKNPTIKVDTFQVTQNEVSLLIYCNYQCEIICGSMGSKFSNLNNI